jgi:hypothetical protein
MHAFKSQLPSIIFIIISIIMFYFISSSHEPITRNLSKKRRLFFIYLSNLKSQEGYFKLIIDSYLNMVINVLGKDNKVDSHILQHLLVRTFLIRAVENMRNFQGWPKSQKI